MFEFVDILGVWGFVGAGDFGMDFGCVPFGDLGILGFSDLGVWGFGDLGIGFGDLSTWSALVVDSDFVLFIVCCLVCVGV